jgi:hypothetical protein
MSYVNCDGVVVVFDALVCREFHFGKRDRMKFQSPKMPYGLRQAGEAEINRPHFMMQIP